MTIQKPLKVMFLCTANSCRSQMAEGLAKHIGNGHVEVHSAGMFKHHIQPRSISVMKELGIDISDQKSEAVNKRLLNKMDVVITLCHNAESKCPITPPGIKRLHWPIKDPVGSAGTEEEIMSEFRKARDEIKNRIERFIEEMYLNSSKS